MSLTPADPSPLAEGCDGVRDARTKLEVALCTGILPSPPADSKTPERKTNCLGRVRYLAPGQADADPREWQFRKVSRGAEFTYDGQQPVCDRIYEAKIERKH